MAGRFLALVIFLSDEDADLIRTLARSRLDSRGMPNSKPGLWFQALERIEELVKDKAEIDWADWHDVDDDDGT